MQASVAFKPGKWTVQEGTFFTEILPNFHANIWQSNGQTSELPAIFQVFANVRHCTRKSSSSFCIWRTFEQLLARAGYKLTMPKVGIYAYMLYYVAIANTSQNLWMVCSRNALTWMSSFHRISYPANFSRDTSNFSSVMTNARASRSPAP